MIGAHFPAFQPIEETHAEQIGLHLSVRHHQRRHRTLDQSADREAVERQPGRLGAAAGGLDIDVIFQKLERQARGLRGLIGQHHRRRAGIDHHRRNDAVDPGLQRELAALAARDLHRAPRCLGAVAQQVRHAIAGARYPFGIAIGHHGAGRCSKHQKDKHKAAHRAPPAKARPPVSPISDRPPSEQDLLRPSAPAALPSPKAARRFPCGAAARSREAYVRTRSRGWIWDRSYRLRCTAFPCSFSDSETYSVACTSVLAWRLRGSLQGYSPVPALMIGVWRGRRLSSDAAVLAFSGCSGGASSAIGANADITRSGGKVTMTSVPIRSLDFSVNVPPCMSIRLFAIGSPRPAPCSADLIELDPWPKEASTIGISSSAIPEPVSLTLRYCPPDAVHPTFSQISPPCGVNLIEFDNKLRTIWRVARSSPQIRGMPCSNTS